MAYIENDLHRALYALLEIQRYLRLDLEGDASWDCDAVLESFEGTEALAEARRLIENR